MTARKLGLLLGVALLHNGVVEQRALAQSAPVALEYIANEGVAISHEGKMVLIDALFRDGVKGYATIERETLEKLERAAPPYANVAAVLVTHTHADHFDADSVARHLKSSSESIVVSSSQVLDQVTSAGSFSQSESSRVRSVRPAGDDKESLTIGGIQIEVVKLSHGGGRFAAIENYGFIVHMGGLRLLHIGDAEFNELSRAPLVRHAVGVDVALLPYWWMQNAGARKFVAQTLKPGRVFAIHVPPESATAIESGIRQADGSVVVLHKPKDRHQFSK